MIHRKTSFQRLKISMIVFVVTVYSVARLKYPVTSSSSTLFQVRCCTA